MSGSPKDEKSDGAICFARGSQPVGCGIAGLSASRFSSDDRFSQLLEKLEIRQEQKSESLQTLRVTRQIRPFPRTTAEKGSGQEGGARKHSCRPIPTFSLASPGRAGRHLADGRSTPDDHDPGITARTVPSAWGHARQGLWLPRPRRQSAIPDDASSRMSNAITFDWSRT